MVDLLAPKKKTGFRVDIFPDFELEKAHRAEGAGIVKVTQGQAVWKADDPRWNVKPPYGFVSYRLKYGGACIYCAEHIPAGAFALYSKKVQGVAHASCHDGWDKPVSDQRSALSPETRAAGLMADR